MDYADAPPKDITFEPEPSATVQPAGNPGGGANSGVDGGGGFYGNAGFGAIFGAAGGGTDNKMAIALAMSMTSNNAARAIPQPPAGPPAPPEEPWPPPPQCPEAGTPELVVMRLRLPNGANFTQTFLLEHTLRDVCSVVHHQLGVSLSTAKVRG
jgi:hypothetical protein